MKSLRALKAAGLILAAVVLGLMTVQGSYALWNTAVTANAGTIQAADFSVKVGDLVLAPGQEFQLPEAKLSLASKELITPVSVASAVNVTQDSPFRSITTVTVNPVAAPLVAGVALSNTHGTCPAAAAMYKASAATLPQKTMVKQTFCFRTALKDGTTNQMLGAPVIGPSATLDVTQVASK